MLIKGLDAYIFRGTVEYRELMLNQFDRGNSEKIEAELAMAEEARQPVYNMLQAFDAYMDTLSFSERRQYRSSLQDVEEYLRMLLGPLPGESQPALMRAQYGQTRWDRTKVVLHDLFNVEQWDYSDPESMGTQYFTPRIEEFTGTPLEPLFPYVENNVKAMLRPRLTFYWRFLFDKSMDAHFFGGIWPELLGTFYLTLGAILFAVPMGLIAAIYLTEYARQGIVVNIIRTCINTLAGVPSIVFGLFGLAFFINAMHLSGNKSVIVGSLTLGLLVLPVVIRASEEAILAVPIAYKEASLSLGTSKWWTILTVVLPAALPGILTGIVISMGRAAGETAPIIFTAAVSVGLPLKVFETFSQPTPALPWNIYNLATEHEAVDQIRHVQFGMVLALVALVLALNLTAIILRARIAKKLKG
jgi:phosphate transport system permease protein